MCLALWMVLNEQKFYVKMSFNGFQVSEMAVRSSDGAIPFIMVNGEVRVLGPMVMKVPTQNNHC